MADTNSSIVRQARRVVNWLRALRKVAVTRHIVDAQGALQQALLQAVQNLERATGDLMQRAESASLQLADVDRRLGALQGELANAIAAHGNLAAGHAALTSSVEALGESQRQLAAQIDDNRQVIERELAAQRARWDPPIPQLPGAGNQHDSATWLYAAFEETFRGTRAQIRERLMAYVPDVRAAYDATTAPAVDVGCGRGEWLELMQEQGIAARGVDENALMVERCREFGLDVVCDDAIAYLAGLPERTLSVVTAFHVVEHLSMAKHLQLLAAAHRALVTNGLLIVETPNPENLVVGSWTFHMDPSHIRPLPPTLLRFFVEAAGFEVIDVRRLNVDDDLASRAVDERWPAGIQQLVCGSRDFSIIARRGS